MTRKYYEMICLVEVSGKLQILYFTFYGDQKLCENYIQISSVTQCHKHLSDLGWYKKVKQLLIRT